MFTGIIEESGQVEDLGARAAGARIRIGCRKVVEDLKEGDSVSVNGVCLTAVEISAAGFSADIAPETLRRSNLGGLRRGASVNLERPLTPSSRLGGHIVQGHIDGTAVLVSLELLGDDNWWLKVRIPSEFTRYLVEKGSVALDGISLTIAEMNGEYLSTTIIPHTFRHTTLANYRPGDKLNLECDILAKHVEKLMGNARPQSSLTMDKLADLGY